MSLQTEPRPAAPPHPFSLRRLDWDTDFFGAPMGTIVGEAPPAADPLTRAAALTAGLRVVLQRARAEGYAHLIYRVPADDLPLAWGAAGAGLRLVDIGVDSTYRFGRAALPPPVAAVPIRPAREDDLPALRELAADAFTLSRFSADPFFTAEQVRDFHRQWITNLVHGLARVVLVCEADGVPAGFVSCAMHGDEGRIPLIATDGAHRRLGLGRALVTASLHWFAGARARVAHVKTQAHNYPALALYHQLGFAVSRTDLTYSWTAD